MVLEQDAAQAAQAGNIIAEREYQAQVNQYEKDQKQYESDLKIYNENLAKEKAEAKKKADAQKIRDEEYISDYRNSLMIANKYKLAEGNPETMIAIEKSVAEKMAQNKSAESSISSAKTEEEYKTRLWQYRDTSYGSQEFNKVASPQVKSELALLSQFKERQVKGTQINRQANKAEYLFMGGDSGGWSDMIRKEDANRAVALTQSASLRTGGNAQITSAQTAELARLGGTATSGPTMVSGNISQNRVPVAVDPITGKPSVAAVAQPWGPAFALKPPQAESTPESRWAEIATPGVGMFSGIPQKPTYARPTAKGEVTKNRISPYLIPVGQRSLINQYSPEGKPVQGPARVEQSFVGYDAKGKPVQGAGSPVIEIPSMGGENKKVNMSKSIIDGQVKNFITVPSIGGTTQEVDTSGTNYTIDGKVFPNEKEAQNYIDTKAANPTLTPTGDALFGLSKFLDKAAQYKTGNKLVDISYQRFLGGTIEGARIGVEMSSSISNLLEHEVPKLTGVNMPWISDRTKLDPIPVKTTGDEVALPVAFDEKGNQALLGVRLKTGEEYTTGFVNYAKKYGVDAAITGAATVWVPTAMTVERAGAFILSKIGKATIKGTIKNTQVLAIENAPASVWTSKPVGIGQTIRQGGQTFTKVEKNPFGKERKIPYAISQGVERIKNIKNPITIPNKYNPATVTRGIVQKSKIGVYKISEKAKQTMPPFPQNIKDIPIKARLAGQDITTKAGIIKRTSQIGVSRGIFQGQVVGGKLGAKFEPAVNSIKSVKYRTKIGIQNVKTFTSEAGRNTRVQFGKAVIPAQIFKRNQSIAFGLRKADALTKLSIIKKGITVPAKKVLFAENKTIYKNKSQKNIMDRYEKFQTPKSLLDAKYRTQIGLSNTKEKILIPLREINKQDKIIGGKITIASKVFKQKVGLKIRTEIKSTKQGMFKVLPEEYTFKPKWIVEGGKAQAFRNRFRTGPQTNIDFGKQGASKGQLGRGQLNNIVGDVKRKIGINPRKNFDIPTPKYPKNDIIGPKQPVELSPKTLGNPRKDPMIGTAKTRFIGPRNIVNEAPRSFIGGVPLKFKPNAVEQLKQSEKIRKADRFKLGYKDEPTELQGKIRDIKSITGQTKQKTSAEKFDGIGIDKSKPINPTQGAPKSYIGKGRLDSIVKSAQATSKPKLGVATDVKRIAKRTESGIDKQALRKRREEMKKLTDEAPPSSTGGDIVSSKSKNQSLAPLIQKPEPLKLKKKLPGTPITEGKTNGSVDWTGTEKTGTLILPPIVKVDKKRKPRTARVAPSFSEYGYATESVTVAKVSGRTDAKLITGVSIKSIAAQSTRITPRLAVKTSPVLATRISPILSTKQPQALKQAQPQKFRSPTPEPIRPKQKIAPKFVPKIPLRSKLREIPRDPPRPPRRVGILPPIILKNKESFAKKKKDKQNDFLGNTKLDSIEGLFRRSTIIHGDKRISKQVKKDRKAKFKERGVSFFSKR